MEFKDFDDLDKVEKVLKNDKTIDEGNFAEHLAVPVEVLLSVLEPLDILVQILTLLLAILRLN